MKKSEEFEALYEAAHSHRIGLVKRAQILAGWVLGNHDLMIRALRCYELTECKDEDLPAISRIADAAFPVLEPQEHRASIVTAILPALRGVAE